MADLDIKQTVEDIARGYTAVRSEVDELKAGQKDVVTEQKLQRITDDVTAKLEALQAKQAKFEAAQSRLDAPTEAKDMGRKDLDAYLRAGTAPDGIKVGAEGLEIRAMRTDGQADGGFLVRPALANFVIDRIFETSPVRRLANVFTTGNKALDVLIDDNEAGFRWVGEGASGGKTPNPLLGQKTIYAHKAEADPYVSQEMLEDSYFDVEAWLQGKVVDRISRGENTAFVAGNGVSQPRGFTTYPAWASAGVYERDRIERINSTAATTVAVDGLILTQNALKEDYQAGASWAMKRTTFGAVLRLKSTDNYNFLGLSVAPGNQNIEMRILQKPVTFMDDMAATGAGNIVAAYADWRRFYTIVDRVGFQILRDPFTNKGFVTYYTYKRTGGDVTSFDAGKLMVCAA
jgi:HK97 family phage major capsid protein